MIHIYAIRTVSLKLSDSIDEINSSLAQFKSRVNTELERPGTRVTWLQSSTSGSREYLPTTQITAIIELEN